MKEKIIIVSFSNIRKDSRVKRQIYALKNRYRVITFGYGNNDIKGIEFHKINRNLKILKKVLLFFLFISSNYKKFSYYYFSYERIISYCSKNSIKCFILNDCFAWPLIDFINPKKCILDAHEYSPEEFNDRILWKTLKKRYKYWCSLFANKVKTNFCVEKNLCKKWEDFSGVEFKELRNFSKYHSFEPKKNNSYPLKIVHHGIGNKSRKIENMIKGVINCGNNYEGYFYLDTKSKSLDRKLKTLSRNTNVFIMNPIEENSLIKKCYEYDLAILSIFPSNVNYKYCLPNKLFQFIQSRLPIVAGPTPSIIEIINDYKIGVISKSFNAKDLCTAIKSISIDDLIEMKHNCNKAAKDLSWENESNILLSSVSKIKF